MFEGEGLFDLYRAYDEYVTEEKAEGKKPVGILKFTFGRA